MFKASNMTPSDKIFNHCLEIQAYIEAEYNADNGYAVTDRAQKLEAYMALSGKLLADAKYNYNELLNGEFLTAIKKTSNYPASVINKYIDTLCRDQQYLVDWCERINKACTHQLDMCRSILSTLREELRQSSYSVNH